MTKVDQPEKLRPFTFHGIDLQFHAGDKNATAECPFCGRSGKFSVNIETGLWRCFGCNEGDEKGKDVKGGNAVTFLRKLWEMSYEATNTEQRKKLCVDRKLLNVETVVEWHLAYSVTTHNWLVPGYNADGKLTGLYQYDKSADGKRMMLWPTPTMSHHLMGLSAYNPKAKIIFLCEGVWDGMVLWELLANCKEAGAEFVPTANREASLLSQCSVVCFPAANTFFESWLPLFAGKTVNLMTQNDHARKHPETGADIAPASYNGMKRIAQMMAKADNQPTEVNYLKWGDVGYDTNLPSGYDVRDYLNA